MTGATITDAKAPLAAIRKHLWLSAAAVGVLVGVVAGLLGTISISGAVVAASVLVVAEGESRIEHPDGGTVSDILVREGDAVRAGDVLLRIESPEARAALAILNQGLRQLTTRRARLLAERGGDLAVAFPDEIISATDPETLALLQQERALFQARQLAQAGLKAQLAERIAQLDQQIAGLAAQRAAKQTEIGLAQQQRDATREMWAKQLVEQSQLTAVERDYARLEGEHGALIAATAELRGRVAEIRLQVIQIDDDFRSRAAGELADLEGAFAEALERQVAAARRVGALDVRAPRDGVVHQMTIRALGGTVTAGETILTIVPTGNDLVAEARVSPVSIDQLHIGQQAFVRLSAFDPATTPEVSAEVIFVSADLERDPRTGEPYYKVRMRLDAEGLKKLGPVTLVPGMPAESFIRTSERTILSYLLKPLSDQASRSFRD